MQFNVRYIIKDDYENTLKKWWSDWNWDAPPFDMLPSTGIVVSFNGVDICAGFMYKTDSKIAWLEYVVSNREYKESNRAEAIEFLLQVLCSIADTSGFKYIYASLKSQPLIAKYQKTGFIKGDSNCQEMIKILWQE
jgi:hypothetical protein